jgi:D-serine deaminase-like pyridoxal phosphate-dependent protein
MALDRQVRLTVALDSAAAVEALAEAARASARTVRVLVEVNLGMRRVGVGSAVEAIALAELVDRRPPLEYAGVAFYPGHIREPVAEQGAKVAQLRRDLAALIAALARAGYAPPTVSGGSTPLAWRMHEVEGVTEVRPGTYVFNDRATVDTGACALEDCALTVLATVVSVAVPGQAVIDAGSKALAREPAGGAPEEGYGILLERPEVRVRRMSEEHGILDLGDTDWRPAVGERVRVVPNHVCAAVHLFDTLHGVRNEVVETSWPVAARGRAAGEVSRAF